MKRGGGLSRGKPLERGGGLARGKPLERGTGLSRGQGLDRGKGLERGDSQLDRSTRIAPRSKKRAAQMKDDRIPLIVSLVEAGVKCEVSMVFEELGIPHHCTREIEGMHERRKSGSGGSRVNRANLVPACNWCNGYIEDAIDLPGKPYRTLIEESYLVLRETEADRVEFEAMSKRHDRSRE